MNSLYSLALRQVSSLQAELSSLEHDLSSSSATRSKAAGEHGQIVSSLVALQRTLDDYEAMSQGEVVETKRLKAEGRIQKFREDLKALRKHHDQVKTLERRRAEESERDELFGQSQTALRSSGASLGHTAESPYQTNVHRTNAAHHRGAGLRTASALDEHQFLNQANNTLDIYIAQGQAILGNLGDQREMLKGTQKRLRSAANALGLSRETIQFIERRSKGDLVIFGLGAVFTLVSFYYILKIFG